MPFERFCQTMRRLAPERACWIVGLSGGADSACLLELCAEYKVEVNPEQTIIAAHLNHHLRGIESDGDEAFCGDLCRERDIPIEIEQCHVRAQAKAWGVGLEEAGRRARHAMFARLSRQYAPAAVLLAHHADDQAETVLFRFLRGTDPGGLCGMREETTLYPGSPDEILILRPLLEENKETLAAFLQDQGLSWREDATNLEADVDRNKIRLEILPQLEAFRPGLSGRLCQLAQAIRETDSCVQAEAERQMVLRSEEVVGGVLLHTPEGPEPMGNAVLSRMLHETVRRYFPDVELTAGHRTALLSLYRSGRQGAALELSEGCLARRERDGLMILPLFELPEQAEIILPETLPLTVNAGSVTIQAERVKADDQRYAQDKDNPDMEWLHPEAIRGALHWRPRRAGDRFQPLGAPGSRKLKDVMIDAKLSLPEKRAVRLLCDDEGILWAWPLRLAERARLDESATDAIRIEIVRHAQPEAEADTE